jgi:hypothetical protein
MNCARAKSPASVRVQCMSASEEHSQSW